MISNWTYTDIPDGIDLERPIMPLRDDSDNGIYGVDPAWLHEVLAVWSQMLNTVASQVKIALPERPSADFTNGLRETARGIKISNGGYRRFVSSCPASAFNSNIPDAVSFGDIPDDVEVGDPVLKTDTSEMFDWMNERVKYLCFPQEHGTTLPTPSVVESGTDGTGSLPAPVEAPVVYDWNWYYSNGTHSDENGFCRRSVTSPFTISVILPGLRAEWFDSVSMFISASSHVEPETQSSSLWVPLPSSFSQTASGLLVSATCSGNLIRDAFGVTEKAYKEDLIGDADYRYGSYRHTVQVARPGATPGIVGFLSIDDDYLYPTGATT